MGSLSESLSDHAQFEAAGKTRTWMNQLFSESLMCIDVRNVLTHRMVVIFGCLRIDELSYPLSTFRRVVLIAAGKAAVSMCSTTAEILRPGLDTGQILTGVAIGPGSRESLPPEVSHFAGSHPFPDQTSRNAAEEVRDLLRHSKSDDLVLFLISGGASSMLETPIVGEISVEELSVFYQALVYSGLPITQMNTLRKHLSAIKGGRLAELAAPATQCTLIVSDAPRGSLDTVGSGPSMPDRSTAKECREILLTNPGLTEKLSPAVRELLLDPELLETPKSHDGAFARSSFICLLSNDSLLQQAKLIAKRNGYYVEIDNNCDDWRYQEASQYLIQRILRLRQQHSKVCLLSGGEISVEISKTCGVGGRNQHFTLYTALRLAKVEPYIAILSAGSDGVDGNSPAAGAIADSFTIANAEANGLDGAQALARFDSHRFFDAMHDAITTGPTGNNVRDIRILVSP